jgi:hypothetical protein
MSNFTKDELEDILLYLKHPMWVDSQRLIAKLQSLIDNYCEHDVQLAWFDGPGGTYKCKKCGEFYR